MPYHNVSDETLFEHIKNNEEEAFEILFKKYYATLCIYATRITGNQENSQDLTQEFFINFWNNRANIIIQTALKPYLFKSVKNHCINFLKKEAKNSYVSLETITNSNISEKETLDEKTFEDISVRLHTAIEELPEKCREIFRLSRFQRLKYREIAEKMSISEKTVESQMSIAFKKLREALKDTIIS